MKANLQTFGKCYRETGEEKTSAVLSVSEFSNDTTIWLCSTHHLCSSEITVMG